MTRRLFWTILSIGTMGLLYLAWFGWLPRHVPRVAFLGYDSSIQTIRLDAFRDGMRALGYIDGRNVIFDVEWAEGRFDRLPALAAGIVSRKPDVIVTAAPPMVRAAQAATTSIPIVMSVHDPIGMGFAESLARPGANITGVAFQDSELSTKRLDLLRQMVPNLTRVAVVWNEQGGGSASVLAVTSAAKAMGIEPLVLEVNGPEDFPKIMQAANDWGAQGMIQMASPLITKNNVLFVEQLRQHGLPATCEMRMYVEHGCLMTYSASLSDMFRQLASFVDRILKGANPADIAMEQPREFEFVINLDTARALGLAVPPLVLMQTTLTIPEPKKGK